MKYMMIIGLVILLSNCVKNKSKPLINSPSGSYFVSTISNSENLVRVILFDSESNEIDTFDTGASIYSKYNHGWHPTEDHVIIYSGDIGTLTFKIENEKLVQMETPEEYYTLGEKIRNQSNR